MKALERLEHELRTRGVRVDRLRAICRECETTILDVLVGDESREAQRARRRIAYALQRAGYTIPELARVFCIEEHEVPDLFVPTWSVAPARAAARVGKALEETKARVAAMRAGARS